MPSTLPQPEEPQLAAQEPALHDGGILETLESIVIAFVLAFVFRAFIVEAFVIPTGSMAPTLLGQHIVETCPQCGYRFVVGPKSTDRATDGTRIAEPIQRDLDHPCPMCEYDIHRHALPASAGDRILVLKYLYALSEPRRWDVVVFKNPKEPDVNYIKRLVGLPSEQLWIVNGNVYTRPLTPEGTAPNDNVPWQVQRKIDRPEAQQAVWRAIYDTDYLPLDGGESGGDSERGQSWQMPWKSVGETAAGWSAERGGRWRYEDERGRAGTLRFDFYSRADRYNSYPYNLHEAGSRGFDDDQYNTVQEMRIGATITPTPDTQVVLTTANRDLWVRARIGAEGTVHIESAPRSQEQATWTERSKATITPLPTHRGTHVELWHVDQSASVWIDGKRVAGTWAYDLADLGLTLKDVADRAHSDEPPPLPIAEIAVSGGPVLLRSIRLDRDLYYTQATSYPGRATSQGPTTIAANHFFCLGDNSPSSEDSRRWTDVDPWVTAIHDVPPGFVPRELMLGRAFFIYYPASHHFGKFPVGVPNFGDMRFIH